MSMCKPSTGTFQVGQMVQNPPAVQETWAWSLGGEVPLEESVATHSSILAWRIPGTEGPGGLLSMGSYIVRHDWSDLAAAESIQWGQCLHILQLCKLYYSAFSAASIGQLSLICCQSPASIIIPDSKKLAAVLSFTAFLILTSLWIFKVLLVQSKN